MDDVEAKLVDTEKEAEKARKDSKTARDQYNDVKKRRFVETFSVDFSYTNVVGDSCEMFNKAYNHISERIDQVYKDLTKGKASPMGGVAYLSLEDSEVSCINLPGQPHLDICYLGTLCCRNQIPRHASHETIPGYGATFWW